MAFTRGLLLPPIQTRLALLAAIEAARRARPGYPPHKPVLGVSLLTASCCDPHSHPAGPSWITRIRVLVCMPSLAFAAIAVICSFYVQHIFEGTSCHPTRAGAKIESGALESTSYLQIRVVALAFTRRHRLSQHPPSLEAFENYRTSELPSRQTQSDARCAHTFRLATMLACGANHSSGNRPPSACLPQPEAAHAIFMSLRHHAHRSLETSVLRAKQPVHSAIARLAGLRPTSGAGSQFCELASPVSAGADWRYQS